MSEEIDIGKALKAAISTGKVEFGTSQTEKAIRDKSAQLVIVSENCPSTFITENKDVKVRVFKGNNMELGAVCGVPYSVAALAIIDKGTSNILTL